MKLLHLTYHFQYREMIQDILDHHEIENYVRYPMLEGKDNMGKHFGSQVYPGNVSVIQAQVPESELDELLNELKDFRDEKKAHEHLEALVLPIERRI